MLVLDIMLFLSLSVSIFSLDATEQLDVYKSCLKEAARRVRNEALVENPDGSQEKKLVLSSIPGFVVQ